ncbi:MAG: acetate--CoA ligase family protein [Deltaproteobacteria bacterium]|nr:acetate--CoA ligase family protein [Deltaproteobacteria bacterium]
MEIIEKALLEKRKTLSEYESKRLLASHGIPVTREILVSERNHLSEAIRAIGFPLVMKGCAPDISHKTERSLVRVDIRSEHEALEAFDQIVELMKPATGAILVQEMIRGKRELMAGLTRDPQFGPCVMFGLGGILTEILKDICFRVAPLNERDALSMMAEIRGHKILDAVRGMEPVDRDLMARILVTVGAIGLENECIREMDINPLIIQHGKPVAVDALVVLDTSE